MVLGYVYSDGCYRTHEMVRPVVALGKHAIFDLEFPAETKILYGGKKLLNAMEESCLAEGATIIESSKKKFKGGGFTFMIVLAESHASCHTWPEHGVATFDIFMCGKCDPYRTMDRFVDKIREIGYPPQKVIQTKITRGFIPDATKNSNSSS